MYCMMLARVTVGDHRALSGAFDRAGNLAATQRASSPTKCQAFRVTRRATSTVIPTTAHGRTWSPSGRRDRAIPRSGTVCRPARLRVPPTGARATWRRPLACRCRACSASGVPLACSRITPRRSSSRPIRCSSRKCAMSSAFMSRRRSARSCSASMRKSQIPALDRNTGLDGGRGAAIQQSHGSLLLEELDIPSRQVGPTHPEAVGHPRDKVRLYSPHKPLFGLLIGSNVAQPRG